MKGRAFGEIVLYQRSDGAQAVEVHLDGDTVWLTQPQIADLFQTSRENINMHLRNVFVEGELDPTATSKDFLQVREEGTRTVRRSIAHYNPDAMRFGSEASVSIRYTARSESHFADTNDIRHTLCAESVAIALGLEGATL